MTIVVIRIRGLVGIRNDIERTLDILRLRKKFSCILVENKPDVLGMLKKASSIIAYGEIDEETKKELISKRGKSSGDRHIKGVNEKDIRPFFRLHPPIGGFKKSTKLLYPKGVLGENKKINELLRRML